MAEGRTLFPVFPRLILSLRPCSAFALLAADMLDDDPLALLDPELTKRA